ncbi:CvfD/Ygs/GSP13 family RNA-binding post-transcriptional regulator [Vagococcus acidifermentans]|uniref:RNA-binding protein n=1 Tax=Vagococcus acidifermentans TaxID=564710 RepID=A0A430ASE9_9ENTE|nr:CvfD/Ygs/GSP13 family RNA-binding post-transcriptional regulator [Vagococcus acidifermentans]RSU10981.1 RNA-binding protein [Vagococcus acidifermentans]
MDYKIGMTVRGNITGIQSYGAFVSLGNGEQGLIHVSEVKNGYIKNIGDTLKVGQQVDVLVIDIDEYSQKISLSLRALETKGYFRSSRKKRYATNKNKKIGFKSIAQALPGWMDEALQKNV